MVDPVEHESGRTPPPLPFRSFLAFLALVGLQFTLAISLISWLIWADVPTELVVTNAALLVLVGLLAGGRQPSARSLRRCVECGSRVFPTRRAEGRRLWTCFGCGHEALRRRTIRELTPGRPGAPRPGLEPQMP